MSLCWTVIHMVWERERGADVNLAAQKLNQRQTVVSYEGSLSAPQKDFFPPLKSCSQQTVAPLLFPEAARRSVKPNTTERCFHFSFGFCNITFHNPTRTRDPLTNWNICQCSPCNSINTTPCAVGGVVLCCFNLSTTSKHTERAEQCQDLGGVWLV